jgi:hypothetical protein
MSPSRTRVFHPPPNAVANHHIGYKLIVDEFFVKLVLRISHRAFAAMDQEDGEHSISISLG